ncbi:transposase (partial) [Erwinia amylovora Ea644]|nr:transposase (partial) [Erwinia amylovora Ea644]
MAKSVFSSQRNAFVIKRAKKTWHLAPTNFFHYINNFTIDPANTAASTGLCIEASERATP